MPDELDHLTPRQRELVKLLAELLVADYRAHPPQPVAPPVQRSSTKWLTIKEAADYAKSSPKLIYKQVAANRLRAARAGRKLVFTAEWIDQWLEASAPKEIPPKK